MRPIQNDVFQITQECNFMNPVNRLNLPIFMSVVWLVFITPVFAENRDRYESNFESFKQDLDSPGLQMDVDADLGFECLLQPFLSVRIGSPVPGALADVNVKRGDLVKKGQVVAVIDSRVQVASVRLAKMRYEYSQRQLERSKDLATGNFLSSQETDELETNAQMAKQELAERDTQVEIRRIRSPLDGVVVDRFKGPGEYVQESEIMELAQINPLNVEMILPVKYFGSIKLGMVTQVIPQAPVGGVYEAKVMMIDKVIDAASGTFGVRLEIPNPGNKIPAGLRCYARVSDL
jgi:RND family efflux transporter MFP subunit